MRKVVSTVTKTNLMKYLHLCVVITTNTNCMPVVGALCVKPGDQRKTGQVENQSDNILQSNLVSSWEVEKKFENFIILRL